MAKYSQGICDDGAAILEYGRMMTVDEIVARLNELEEHCRPITAILAYRNKGYRGVCGTTVGADGQGFYAVVYRGLSFDAASNHARNLIRELDASKYQIGECLFVDALETVSGNTISIITEDMINV